MSKEIRDLYIEFLREKGCVTEGLQDIFVSDGEGGAYIKTVTATKIDHKSEYYDEFCKLYNLDFMRSDTIFTFTIEDLQVLNLKTKIRSERNERK